MKDALPVREEMKRDRCWDPAARWRVLQDTITWAEAQATVRRTAPAACLAIERRRRARPAGPTPHPT